MNPLPDADHVARYCKPSTVDERGRPLATAFALRNGEDHLSVNWLEYFDQHSDLAVNQVRRTLQDAGFQLRANGRFALLNVGTVKAAVKRSLGLSLHVSHMPRKQDPSHAGVFGYTGSDLMVAAEMRALVGPDDVRRAV